MSVMRWPISRLITYSSTPAFFAMVMKVLRGSCGLWSLRKFKASIIFAGERVGAYELNRKTYKDVKKMDHGQMSAFCKGMYMREYEAGRKESDGLSAEEIKQAVLQVKGIGEKKADDILQALDRAKERRRLLADG